VRRVVSAVAVFLVALAGVVALLAFFESRDRSTTSAEGGAARSAAAGPGAADPGATSPLLRAGNVELRYARAADRAVLEALAEREAGADHPALRTAGQAVVVVRDPAASAVVARAWKRSLRAGSASDPALQEFVEAWLGRGAAG
jgi:hypothetical protein